MTTAKSVEEQAAAKVLQLASELSVALNDAAKAGVIIDLGVDEVRLAGGQTFRNVIAYAVSLGEQAAGR